MSVISITDFSNWKIDPVTQAFMECVRQRIADGKDFLATSAGLDEKSDNFMRGFIAGQMEVLETSFADVGE